MTEIKQTEESPQAVPVEQPAETASPAEPAHSYVEKVTEKKAKDPKKRWWPGVQALPPGKHDCSKFRRPRNHYIHQSAQLTTTARLFL